MTLHFKFLYWWNCLLLDLNPCHRKRLIKASMKRSGKFKTCQRCWLFQISQLIITFFQLYIYPDSSVINYNQPSDSAYDNDIAESRQNSEENGNIPRDSTSLQRSISDISENAWKSSLLLCFPFLLNQCSVFFQHWFLSRRKNCQAKPKKDSSKTFIVCPSSCALEWGLPI